MMRSLLIGILSAACAALAAGEYAPDVEQLGSKAEAPGAFERLAKAGDEAFEDLMDGLDVDPDEEGVSADEAHRRSQVRMGCARLLGTLGDTRASAKLLQLLRDNSGENPSYPWLAQACANALGRIWAGSDSGDGRNEALAGLRTAAGEGVDPQVRYGALRGLAHMKDGADVAMALIENAEAPGLLRSAAIDIVVATGHKPAGDMLHTIWNTQRGGEARDYVKALGVQALFALADLGDKRAVDGLVDVATLNEFAAHATLRSRAVRLADSDALRNEAVGALVATFKDVDKPTQRQRAAQTLGEFGAPGVTAYLDIADDPPPEPQEGEDPDKYPEDHYRKEVDRWLSSLRTPSALEAFVEAYNSLPEDAEALRGPIVDHLLANRSALSTSSLELFRTAANDESLESPKRAQAINAWAEAMGKESFSDLEQWGKSEDGVIRAQAVQNLGRNYIPLAKSKPLLEEALKGAGEDFAKARQNALSGLQRSDDKDLLPLFLDSLDPEKEPVADVRRTALQSIDAYRRNARLEDGDVYEAVKGRVTDADADVRGQALRLTVTMAQRMGNKNEAVQMVETGLTDESNEVRLQAYQLVSMVAGDVDTDRVIRAALLEDTRDLQGNAVVALSKLRAFGDDTDRQKRVADLALKVIDDRARESFAKDLLGKLFKASPALFTHMSDSIRAKIGEFTTGDRKQYDRVPVLIRTLVEIEDFQYFEEVKELAELPNVELRRACIEYIARTGTRDDISFLRGLREKTDMAAGATRANIDDAIRELEDKE